MSVSYSKIDLLGYIGNNPELFHTNGGATGAKFSLAVNRVWTDASGKLREDVDWFQIITWGQVAENCLTWLTKGRLVFVTGRPQIREWVDEQGGKREKIQVVVNQIIFLGNPEPENTTE